MTAGSPSGPVLSGKLIHLEAARGIASVVVLFHHFALAFLPGLKEAFGTGGLKFTPLYALLNGDLAVNFFFVLSGFVLTLRFYRSQDTSSLPGAVMKRLPRLWLPVALSVLVGWGLMETGIEELADRAAALTGSPWLASFGMPTGAAPSLADALRQSVMVFLHSDDFYYNSNLWTMSVEFWGSLLAYLMVPLVLWLRRRFSVPMVFALHAWILFLLVLKGYSSFGAFVLGSAIAYRVGGLDRRMVLPRWQVAGLGLLVLIGASGPQGPSDIMLLTSAAALMLLLLAVPVFAERMSGRLGKWLGDLSFPLYLVHTLVIVGPGSWICLALDAHLGRGTLLLVLFATVLALSLLLSLPLAAVDRAWTARISRAARNLTPRKRQPDLPLAG